MKWTWKCASPAQVTAPILTLFAAVHFRAQFKINTTYVMWMWNQHENVYSQHSPQEHPLHPLPTSTASLLAINLWPSDTPISFYPYYCTVKPVCNDHPWCQEKVVFPDRWSFQTDSVCMESSGTGRHFHKLEDALSKQGWCLSRQVSLHWIFTLSTWVGDGQLGIQRSTGRTLACDKVKKYLWGSFHAWINDTHDKTTIWIPFPKTLHNNKYFAVLPHRHAILGFPNPWDFCQNIGIYYMIRFKSPA